MCLVRSRPYLEVRGKLPNPVSPLRRLHKQWSRTGIGVEAGELRNPEDVVSVIQGRNDAGLC